MICETTTNIDDKKDSIDDNKENEEKVAMMIDAKTDVLLQTADCIISNPRETKTLKIKVLLDPGSQKTYLSDAAKDYLKLDAITKQNVAIKNGTNGQLKELGELKFALRGLHGNCLRLYIENLWNLDLLGIQENERSAGEIANLSGIEFVNDWYEVKLAFKENVLLVSDTYEMSQNHFNKLKKKLS